MTPQVSRLSASHGFASRTVSLLNQVHLRVTGAGWTETTHPKSFCQGSGAIVLQTVSASHEDLQGQRLALGTGFPVTLGQSCSQDLWGKVRGPGHGQEPLLPVGQPLPLNCSSTSHATHQCRSGDTGLLTAQQSHLPCAQHFSLQRFLHLMLRHTSLRGLALLQRLRKGRDHMEWTTFQPGPEEGLPSQLTS